MHLNPIWGEEGKMEGKLRFIIVKYTGCVKSTGTTFGGCSEPQRDLTKILSSAKRKVFNKSFYDYKIYFLRNHF